MSTLLPKPTVVKPSRKVSDAMEVDARPFGTDDDMRRATSAPNCAKPAGSSRGRLGLALGVGVAADAIQALLLGFPIFTWIIDLITAFIFFGIFGFRKALIIPIIIELIPGVALAPTWTIAAVLLHTTAPKAE